MNSRRCATPQRSATLSFSTVFPQPGRSAHVNYTHPFTVCLLTLTEKSTAFNRNPTQLGELANAAQARQPRQLALKLRSGRDLAAVEPHFDTRHGGVSFVSARRREGIGAVGIALTDATVFAMDDHFAA